MLRKWGIKKKEDTIAPRLLIYCEFEHLAYVVVEEYIIFKIKIVPIKK